MTPIGNLALLLTDGPRVEGRVLVVRKRYIAIGTALLIIGGTVYFARDQVALAHIGTGYAAKQTCSCLYVSRRPLPSCLTDFDPATARWFTWHVGERSVTVSALLGFFSSTSVFDDGFGCHVAE
jgi:hypothetical protein